MCEEKVVTSTRPRAVAKMRLSSLCTSRVGSGDGGGPSSALVESASSRRTPRSPRRARAGRSLRRPSTGTYSMPKSPVCTTVPTAVDRATAAQSGVLWVSGTNSVSKGPTCTGTPGRTSISSALSSSRCSSSLKRSSARVKRRA